MCATHAAVNVYSRLEDIFTNRNYHEMKHEKWKNVFQSANLSLHFFFWFI